jgi:hypothetical protein
MGSMTVEEIYKDRKKFSKQVFEVASSDLVNMGVTVVSYTLKDIRDEEVCTHSKFTLPFNFFSNIINIHTLRNLKIDKKDFARPNNSFSFFYINFFIIHKSLTFIPKLRNVWEFYPFPLNKSELMNLSNVTLVG